MNKIFTSILKMSQNELLDYTYLQLKKRKYKNIIYNSNYIYAEGNIPIMLIAHLDTVYNSPPINILYDPKFKVAWSPEGIGGDDRCGVFAILNIIKEYKPHILFTTEEEKGGIGASYAGYELPCPNVNFLIELDRKGRNEAVFYDCGNKDFQEYITNFGYEKDLGTFSDISIISPLWDIASVNLSIGYYNEHCKNEYICINHLNESIGKIKNILEDNNQIYYDYQDEYKEYANYPVIYDEWWEEELEESEE